MPHLTVLRHVNAFVRTTSDEGVPLSWRTDPPAIAIDVEVPGTPDGGRGAVAFAAKAWSDASHGTIRFRALPPGERSPNRMRWVAKDAWTHGGDDAAYTTLDLDARSGQIRGFVIELNGGKLPGPPLEAVILHEVGHGLGLSHSFAKRAVMSASLGAAPKTALESDDIAAILSIYTAPLAEPPRAAPTSSAALPPGPALPPPPAPDDGLGVGTYVCLGLLVLGFAIVLRRRR